MKREQLKSFFDKLKEDRIIFGPAPCNGKTIVKEIEKFQDLDLNGRLPVFSFKRFFLPEKQELFKYKGPGLEFIPAEGQAIALFGVNTRDLKAVLLYDQVFEKDPWYQERRKSILIIGQMSAMPEGDWEKFEEDLLEHLSFDIFLARLASTSNNESRRARLAEASGVARTRLSEEDFAVFTGSPLGRETLENAGYNDFVHIQFSGPVKERGMEDRFLKIKDKLENHHAQAIWDKLGSRCIECGKCSVVCPTCFCFRIDDKPELGQKAGCGSRERCWDSCFFQEFSEVAGGHKFLNSTAKRIHFWYFHKFSRIPEEFNFPGCVGCHRCAEVCPVGIDIKEVLQEIEKS